MKQIFIYILSLMTLHALAYGSNVISLDKPITGAITPDILYYTFDEEGNIQNESTNQGYNGRARAGSFHVPKPVDGRFGLALHFSGEPKSDASIRNSYVEILQGDELNFDQYSSFTMGVWLRLNADLPIVEGQKIVLFDKGGVAYNGSDSGGFSFYLQRSPGEEESGRWEMIFETRNGQRSAIIKTVPVVLPLANTEWHHVGVSFDRDNQVVVFWFNGDEVDISPESQKLGLEIAITPRGVIIGERQTNGYMSIFQGELDDFFITSGIYNFLPPQPRSSSVQFPDGK